MRLALFFTIGVSLKMWDEFGLLDREIKPYNKLADFFDKIYFITYGDKEDLKYKDLLAKNIIILPKKINLPNKIYSLLIPFFYWQELKNTDILKTNQMAGSWAAVLAKIIFKKKLIVRCGYQWSLHTLEWGMGWFKKLLVYLVELISYKFADAIVVTSNQAKEYVEKRYRISSKKVHLVSNYIDTDLFKSKEYYPNLQIKSKSTNRRLCFVGRLEKQKNLFSLLEAIKILDLNLGLNLVIFGKGSLEDKLKKFSSENNLCISTSKDKNPRESASIIEFRGNIPNNQLPEELNKCEIFILPSFYEGNPKTLLEAMSCGLSVIGTNVRGINNIIKHKENGYLCETSAESIKNAIQEVMGDKELQEKIGKNARQYVVENNSLEKIIKKELKLINKVLF